MAEVLAEKMGSEEMLVDKTLVENTGHVRITCFTISFTNS